MLLEVDGLNKEWNTGILSDWEKEYIECSDLLFAGLSAINTTSIWMFCDCVLFLR
jgi:hypothetical protein